MENKKPISEFLSKKIAFASFFYAVLVVILHSHCAGVFHLDSSTNTMDRAAYIFQQILSQDLVRCAIPTFFAISGYLFFVKANSMQVVWKNIKKRIKTLFVPFVIWNILYVGFTYLTDALPAGISFADHLALGSGLMAVMKKVFGIVFLFKYNVVAWYLFVLIGFVCLTPVLHFALKNKYVSLGVLAVALVVGFFEPIPLMQGKNYTFFFFFLGAFVSKHANEFINRRRTPKQLLPAVILFAASQVMVGVFGFYNSVSDNYPIRFIFEICISISVWFLLDFITLSDAKGYYKYSFALYIVHPIVISACKSLIKATLLPQMGGAVATVAFLVIAVLATVVPIFMFRLLEKVSSKTYSLLTGGR